MSRDSTIDPKPGESENAADRTPFGFRDVDAGLKSGLVRGVFDSVAERYDVMNDLMSGGLHRIWKAALIDWLRPRSSMRLLDVAGGTGDIARRFLDAGGGSAAICDANWRMVCVGRDRAIDRGCVSRIDWVVGDAEALPLPESVFDAYTIAFGLRNVTHIDRALREARRVLKPGGRFFCLEFSHVAMPWLRALYDRYSFNVLPALGSVVAGDREAYQYLVESIRRFPDQETLAERIAAAGLEKGHYRNLSGGIVAIHAAWRL